MKKKKVRKKIAKTTLEFKSEEELMKMAHEVLVHYFFALSGDKTSLMYLLTHPEKQLRELGELMKAKQEAQPQRQIGDGYDGYTLLSDSSDDSKE